MSSGYDGDDELFARVWAQRDAGERPAPDPRRERSTERPDPELARVLDVATALRAVGRATQGPDPDTSARMRAAVMAEIGVGSPAGTTRERTRVLRSPEPGPAGGRGTGRAGAAGRRENPRGGTRPADGRPASRGEAPTRASARRSRGRLLSSFVTGACAVMLLGALTVLLSRGALPGEMLYGIKRASESAEIGLTSGQEAKGRKHLEVASTRLEEVSDLIERQAATAAGAGPVAAGIGPDEAGLVLENLRAFDEQARTGSRLILPLAARPTGPSPAELGEWARSQSARLDTLSPSLDGDGRTAAAGSQQMLQRLDQRAAALGGPERCSTGDASDDLGPLPVDGCDATSQADDTPTSATATPDSTTSSTTTTTTTTRSSTTTSEDETSTPGDADDSGSDSDSGEERTSIPDPVQVPLPVPLLPQVDVPPLLPGLPGLSLG